MNQFLALGILVTATAHAQSVNKCLDSEGKVTYQVAACPGTAKGAQTLGIRDVAPGKPPTGEALQSNKKLCLTMLRHGVRWKDPDSIKVDDIRRIGSGPSLRLTGETVIRYATEVNGKNSYGAYTGNRLAVCEFDLAEKKVQHVHVAED